MPAASSVTTAVLASDLVDDPARSVRSEPIRAQITAARRRRWGKHASLAAVALGTAGGFLALARVIGRSQGSPFDHAVVRAVGRARRPVVNTLARSLTFFGGVVGATLVSSAAAYATRRTPRLAAQISVGALGGVLAELVIKRLFRRERPTLLAHLEDVSSTSFPSGHAMAAASIYLTLAFVSSRSPRLRGHRAALLAGGGSFAAAIAATRVYLGVHWPTDVLAGLALGTGWACLTEAGFDLAAVRHIEQVTLVDCPDAPLSKVD